MRIIKKKVEEYGYRLDVGDQIEIDVGRFGKHTATVHKVFDDKAMLIFDECVAEKEMNSRDTNDGGFNASDLIRWLNSVLYNELSIDIRGRMVADESLNHVSIPSYGMIFGHDSYYENYIEEDDDEQLPLMKKARNRVSEMDGQTCYYWIKNKRVGSAAYFALVYAYGYAGDGNASNAHGVRPLIFVSNL